MKISSIFVGFLVLSNCNLPQLPNAGEGAHSHYLVEEVIYDRQISRWLLKSDSSYLTGIVEQFYPSGTLARKFSVEEGKKHGIQSTYFEDGRLKFQESFLENKLDGEVKRWTQEDGYQLKAHLLYKQGKLHGEQRQWYSTGELHKRMNWNMGKEEGLQQAFRKNGALYANYEAKNGRVFGMKRSNLCYELDNEEVVYYQ